MPEVAKVHAARAHKYKSPAVACQAQLVIATKGGLLPYVNCSDELGPQLILYLCELYTEHAVCGGIELLYLKLIEFGKLVIAILAPSTLESKHLNKPGCV